MGTLLQAHMGRGPMVAVPFGVDAGLILGRFGLVLAMGDGSRAFLETAQIRQRWAGEESNRAGFAFSRPRTLPPRTVSFLGSKFESGPGRLLDRNWSDFGHVWSNLTPSWCDAGQSWASLPNSRATLANSGRTRPILERFRQMIDEIWSEFGRC